MIRKTILLIIVAVIVVTLLTVFLFSKHKSFTKKGVFKVEQRKTFQYTNYTYRQLRLWYENCSRCYVVLEIPQGFRKLNLAYVVHGGGFVAGRATGFSNMAKFFLEKGYAVASVEYRLCTNWDWLTVIGDIARGVKASYQYLVENGYEIQKRIYIGSSAGAVAGAVLIYDPPTSLHDISGLVDSFIGLSGGYCISALPEWRHAEEKLFCNTTVTNIMPFDQLEMPPPRNVPALLVNGNNDKLLDRNAGKGDFNTHASCMEKYLKNNGVTVKVVIIEGGHIQPMKEIIVKDSDVYVAVQNFVNMLDKEG